MIFKYLWFSYDVSLHVLYLEWSSHTEVWQVLQILIDLIGHLALKILFLQFHTEFIMNQFFFLYHHCALINPFLFSEPHSIYFSYFFAFSSSLLMISLWEGQCQIHFVLYSQHQVQHLAYHNTYKINECGLNSTHIQSVSV